MVRMWIIIYSVVYADKLYSEFYIQLHHRLAIGPLILIFSSGVDLDFYMSYAEKDGNFYGSDMLVYYEVAFR